MQAQDWGSWFETVPLKRSTVKVAFANLAKVAQLHEIQLDIPITLTQRNNWEAWLNSLQVETSTIWRLSKTATGWEESEQDSQTSDTDF